MSETFKEGGRRETIRPQSLRQQVIDRIIHFIASGQLKPGERIVEADLAASLGISRGPVREALSTLAQEGILNNLPYKGTFVTELNKDEIREVYTLRAVLEAFAARRLIADQRRDTIKLLKSCLAAMGEAARSGQSVKMAELDMKFHEMIVLASGNAHLHRAWNPLRYRFLLYSILTMEKRYDSFDRFLELA
jgi:DNA-binding GntR family transcriptional regulator